MDNLPSWLHVDNWESFKEMRKLKGNRAPFTQRAEQMILRRLEEFHRQGYDTTWILEDAVINGWSSVYVNNRTPMRALTQQEKHTAATVMHMVQGIGKK